MCGRYASTASRANLREQFVVDDKNADELRGQDFNVTPDQDQPRGAGPDPRGGRHRRRPGAGVAGVPVGAVAVLGQGPQGRRENCQRPRRDRAREAGLPARVQVPVGADPGGRVLRMAGDRPGRQVGHAAEAAVRAAPGRLVDGSTLALAGLYEVWYDKSHSEDDPNRVVPTYTTITTSATDSVGRVHDRMPMAIAPEHWAEWLDPRNRDVDHFRGLMSPRSPAALTCTRCPRP
jgi:hypothetical protein